MTESEKLFRQLLEARGLVHGEHFWFDEEIFSQLPSYGPIPDFYLKRGEDRILVEIKELQSEGASHRGRSIQSVSVPALQNALVDPLVRAKKQLRPYARELKIPTMVVFFDTNGTHLLTEHTLGLAFGQPQIIIEHDPITGRGADLIPHRAGGQMLNDRTGTYISALGVLGYDSLDGFSAWAAQDESLAKIRIRVLPNPHASITAPLGFFNAPRDVIYTH